VACIFVHNIGLDFDKAERTEEERLDENYLDQFARDGMESERSLRLQTEPYHANRAGRRQLLQEGKQHRERLKLALFTTLRRDVDLGLEDDSEDEGDA
jgi:hypothetical protein